MIQVLGSFRGPSVPLSILPMLTVAQLFSEWRAAASRLVTTLSPLINAPKPHLDIHRLRFWKAQVLSSFLVLEIMSTLKSATSALKAFFTSSQQPRDQAPFITTFPQFPKLPIELRLKIWAYALESRSLRIHLHKFYPSWLNDEQRYEGYAPDWPEHSSLTSPFDGPKFVPTAEEEGGVQYGYPDTPSEPRPYHMAITPCTDCHPCGCEYYPPVSNHARPLPASLSACHESREAGIGQYIRCIEDEYDVRGLAVVHPVSSLVKSPPSRPPQTGIIINPSLDTLILRINVASRSDVQEVHHLASILSHHLPEVRKVVIRLRIAMPPYKHWQPNRIHYWRKWGEDGWWVPVRFLLKLRGLREVVLVCNLKEKMLPVEWRVRTEGQWVEELLRGRRV
jgi:hypothetical protein